MIIIVITFTVVIIRGFRRQLQVHQGEAAAVEHQVGRRPVQRDLRGLYILYYLYTYIYIYIYIHIERDIHIYILLYMHTPMYIYI